VDNVSFSTILLKKHQAIVERKEIDDEEDCFAADMRLRISRFGRLSPGTASVTVETEDGGFTAVSEVTVRSRLDLSRPIAKQYAIDSGNLTYSDDTVSLFSAVIIPHNGGDYDAVVYGDLSLSPREYYTYMFATGEVTISGTDTPPGMGTITWSNVECGYGWNILKVENDFAGNTTIKNGSIAAPEWTMLVGP
jgi:hypothetical protein